MIMPNYRRRNLKNYLNSDQFFWLCQIKSAAGEHFLVDIQMILKYYDQIMKNVA